MKKLIMTVCAIAFAAAAQAAQVNWTASGIAEYGKTTPAASSLGYIGILINATICSRDDMIAALGKGDTSKIASAMIANSQTTIGSPAAGWAMKNGAGSFGDGETVNAYALIFDADAIADAAHVYVTNEGSGKTGDKGQAAAIGLGAQTNSQSTSNWYAVPEPTSGLLLLLGVAGLALRRRCA